MSSQASRGQQCDTAAPPPPLTIPDEIAQLFADIQAAWSAGDADRLGKPFAADATFVAFDGTRLTGSDAIVEFHRKPFQTHLRGMMLVIRPTAITSLTDTVYLVAATGGPIRPSDTRGRFAGEETQTFICQNLGGGWAVVSFHNTPMRRLTGMRTALLWAISDFLWNTFAPAP